MLRVKFNLGSLVSLTLFISLESQHRQGIHVLQFLKSYHIVIHQNRQWFCNLIHVQSPINGPVEEPLQVLKVKIELIVARTFH